MSNESNGLKKILLSISAILGIGLLVSGLLLLHQMYEILGQNDVEEVVDEPSSVEERSIEELPEFDGYTLRRNPTEYQLELFDLLVYAHAQFYETESDEDLMDYASAIVRNFVADFFTLSNKNTRTDVGGLQFFSEDIVDNFRNLAIDEFYLYLNQYIEKFGSEPLPTVASTTILNVEFERRIIGTEDEDEDDHEAYTPLGYLDYEEEIRGEEVRTIIVDIEWSYANSTLPYIDEFQTEARFILVEHEESVRIYMIELPEIDYDSYN